MELEREARKSRFARPNQLPDTEPAAPKLLREKAPDALEDVAPHIVPASPMMFGTQEGPLSEENDPCALQLLADEPQGDNQSQHKAINVDVPGPDD
jgi:hypothetical protein